MVTQNIRCTCLRRSGFPLEMEHRTPAGGLHSAAQRGGHAGEIPQPNDPVGYAQMKLEEIEGGGLSNSGVHKAQQRGRQLVRGWTETVPRESVARRKLAMFMTETGEVMRDSV